MAKFGGSFGQKAKSKWGVTSSAPGTRDDGGGVARASLEQEIVGGGVAAIMGSSGSSAFRSVGGGMRWGGQGRGRELLIAKKGRKELLERRR